MTVRINDLCSAGEDCAAVDRTREGWLKVTGYQLDQHGHRLPDDPETDVEVPDSLFPDTAAQDVPNLGTWIADRHTRDALRVQTLARYDVASDGDDYERYRDGRPFVASPTRAQWRDTIAARRDQGRLRRNLHIVREPLTDYLRYQFEWGYTYLDDVLDIRILTVTDGPAAEQLFHVGDYTVVDQLHVVRSRYSTDGIYLGATAVPAAGAHGYAALAEVVWGQAVPFAAWWADRPRYHRRPRAA